MSQGLAAGREALLQGRPGEAAPIFSAAVEATPSDYEARYWLASAQLLLGQWDEADAALADARTLHALAQARAAGADLAKIKADPEYANAIASQLYGQGMVAMASVVWGLAISAGRLDAQTLASYALSLQHQGRVEEAATIYRAAAENFPSPAMGQFLVYAELFCDDGERRYAAEARAWAARHAPLPPAPHTNRPLAGRKLRLGFVAPNFSTSQLKQFIAPVFEALDPAVVEVVLYPSDAATETGWPSWFKVHPIGKLGDDEAAALIRRDGIDVLNDCWGHTAGSRLQVFARKPAPVQVAWINFFQTTGLPQMDYVFQAACGDPPDLAAMYAETLWPLGPVFTPFRPGAGREPPVATPARSTGIVTFGSFNHPAKLNPGVISAWGDLLRSKPDSRLVLKYRYFADPVLQRAVQTQFAARGVEPERIVFSGHSAGGDYYRSFQAIDLMLDSWPAPGSTTTLECLSNGVPLLAMVSAAPNTGEFYARTILRAVGLDELITSSPEDFVQRAIDLTEDLDQLDALRARVRPAFEASAICDEAGFTRGLERAYREMFERWQAPAKLGPLAAAVGAR